MRAVPLDRVDGKPIAVSGIVVVPKGKTPKGGWPVITYDHGTTGIADVCAPRATSRQPGAPTTPTSTRC